jgi:hypothetical protein
MKTAHKCMTFSNVPSLDGPRPLEGLLAEYRPLTCDAAAAYCCFIDVGVTVVNRRLLAQCQGVCPFHTRLCINRCHVFGLHINVLAAPCAGEDPEIAAAEDEALKVEAGESGDESTQTTAEAGSDEL